MIVQLRMNFPANLLSKRAADVSINPNSSLLLSDQFCFVCGEYLATNLCRMHNSISDDEIENFAKSPEIAKKRKFELSRNISPDPASDDYDHRAACCNCCNCDFCDVRVKIYCDDFPSTPNNNSGIAETIIHESTVTISQTNESYFQMYNDYDFFGHTLYDSNISNEDYSRDDEVAVVSAINDEKSYLLRTAGNSSGQEYINNRIKVDMFVDRKFISAALPAAMFDETNWVTTKWDEFESENIFVSDELYHSVIVLLNSDIRKIGVCTCRFSCTESGNCYRNSLEDIISSAFDNTSLDDFDNMVEIILGRYQSSHEIFEYPIKSPECLECVHTKVRTSGLYLNKINNKDSRNSFNINYSIHLFRLSGLASMQIRRLCL